MEGKRCTQCGETKPLDQFRKRAAATDGLAPKCKSCMREVDAQETRRNRERIAATGVPEVLTCKQCGQTKPATVFQKSTHAIIGVTRLCEECANRIRQSNRDLIKATTEHRVSEALALGLKCCNKCGVTRSLSDFHRVRSNPDGLHRTCSECILAAKAARYRDDPDYRERQKQHVATWLGYAKTVPELAARMATSRRASQIKRVARDKLEVEYEAYMAQIGEAIDNSAICKTCATCQTDKPLTAFSLQPGGSYGRCRECKECQKNKYNLRPEVIAKRAAKAAAKAAILGATPRVS